MKIRILIVEDQSIEANNLKIILKKSGYHVCTIAATVAQALTIIEEEKPDLSLLDIQLKGNQTGIDLARVLAARRMAFLFLSANSDVQTLNLAKATRPYGFLLKPFRQKDVLVMLDVALYLHHQTKQESSPIPGPAETAQQGTTNILGKSEKMKPVFEQLQIVAQSDTSVLILGESGTGKELVANSIHQLSKRSQEPFVVVNCGALPGNLIESHLFGHEKGSFTGAYEKHTGKFEAADGGTIFLDEIGELPVDLQVKFLRVLQQREIEPIGGKKRPVSVRVIAATNRDLEEEMSTGRFRMDLYYRLNVFPIQLPPLRERREDIPMLAQHFVRFFAAREGKAVEGLSDVAMRSLLDYSWPGNIRELENMMERSVLLARGTVIQSVPLPVGGIGRGPAVGADGRVQAVGADGRGLPTGNVGSRQPNAVDGSGLPAGTHGVSADAPIKTIAENERDHIRAALEKTNWKIFGPGGAAELLEINGSTLQSRMKKLGIEKKIISR